MGPEYVEARFPLAAETFLFQDSKENKTRIETQTFFQPVEQTYTPKNDISSEPSINFQKIRHVFQGGYLKKKKQLTSGEFQKNIKKKHMLEKNKQKKLPGFPQLTAVSKFPSTSWSQHSFQGWSYRKRLQPR